MLDNCGTVSHVSYWIIWRANCAKTKLLCHPLIVQRLPRAVYFRWRISHRVNKPKTTARGSGEESATNPPRAMAKLVRRYLFRRRIMLTCLDKNQAGARSRCCLFRKHRKPRASWKIAPASSLLHLPSFPFACRFGPYSTSSRWSCIIDERDLRSSPTPPRIMHNQGYNDNAIVPGEKSHVGTCITRSVVKRNSLRGCIYRYRSFTFPKWRLSYLTSHYWRNWLKFA